MNELSEPIHWLAFRYVADEMSVDEAALFEERLADDQRAREAVAAAVELTQAACLALAPKVDNTLPRRFPERTGGWGGRLAWIGIGAAASALVAASVHLFFSAGDRPAPETARIPSESVSPQLAMMWLETGDTLAAGDDLWDSTEPASKEARFVLDEARVEGIDEAAAPSWIYAAVAGVVESAEAHRDLKDQDIETRLP